MASKIEFDQIASSNERNVALSGEPQSSGKSAHAERYRKSDAENVYDHADDHQLHGKRTLGSSGERQHNAVHEEIDGHAIQHARKDRVLYQETNSAAGHKVGQAVPLRVRRRMLSAQAIRWQFLAGAVQAWRRSSRRR